MTKIDFRKKIFLSGRSELFDTVKDRKKEEKGQKKHLKEPLLTGIVVGLPPDGRFWGRPAGIVKLKSLKVKNGNHYKYNLVRTWSDSEEVSGSELFCSERFLKF